MKRFKLSRAKWLAIAAVFVLLGAGGYSYYATMQHKPPAVATVQPLSPTQFQDQVTKLTSLMKTKGVAASFAYTEQQIKSNPSFAKSCHPLLHELGHAAYAYYGGYAQAIQYQNELCDSGYTHGVLESYLGSGTNIFQALQSACSSSLTVFNQWQCYHGLGHGVMLVSLGNVSRSTILCNTLPTTFDKGACTNGVFMQHFVVTNHDGDIPKTNPTGLKDCLSQPVAYKDACYNYAPSAYLTVYNGQYKAAEQWCNGAEAGYISTCIEGVGSQAMKENITNVETVKHVCDQSGAYVNFCISGAVGMDIYFNGALSQAESLCQNQFKAYQAACNVTIAADKSALQL